MSDLDQERYPTLSSAGAEMLRFMREHPAAPIFRNQSGNRLNADDVGGIRLYEKEVLDARIDWGTATYPEWLDTFLIESRRDVPAYRGYPAVSLRELPTISRADLSRDITRFVPDSLPLDRVINFRTSGTTGHPLLLPSHPAVAGRYLCFHKRALKRFGLTLRNGRGQVGVVLVGFQEKCFTYTSVTPLMDESGLAKINLHLNDWRDPDDRVRYLDALNAEVYTGDPISFAELLNLPLRTKPRAMVSTSMALTQAMRERLERHFACPVLDVYSMNEAGPIGVFDARVGGHVLLQHRMYVEIVDTKGSPVAPGERGEVTLTGGFNTYLPLLRYRTGDQASLERRGGEWVLVGLEGRPPVRFRTDHGEWKNNIEVTHALQAYAIPQYTLHQAGDGAFLFRAMRGSVPLATMEPVLRRMFGRSAQIAMEEVERFDGKVVQYTSDLCLE